MESNTVIKRKYDNPDDCKFAEKIFSNDFLTKAFQNFVKNNNNSESIALTEYKNKIYNSFKNKEMLIHRMVVKFKSKWDSNDYQTASARVFSKKFDHCVALYKELLLAGKEPVLSLDEAIREASVGAREDLINIGISVPYIYTPPSEDNSSVVKTKKSKPKLAQTPKKRGRPKSAAPLTIGNII